MFSYNVKIVIIFKIIFKSNFSFNSKNRFSESETNLIDILTEDKVETCFVQSSQENIGYDVIDFMRVHDFIAIQEIIEYCLIF